MFFTTATCCGRGARLRVDMSSGLGESIGIDRVFVTGDTVYFETVWGVNTGNGACHRSLRSCCFYLNASLDVVVIVSIKLFPLPKPALKLGKFSIVHIAESNNTNLAETLDSIPEMLTCWELDQAWGSEKEEIKMEIKITIKIKIKMGIIKS